MKRSAPHRNPENFPTATNQDLRDWRLSLRFEQQVTRIRRFGEVATAKAIAGAGAVGTAAFVAAERPVTAACVFLAGVAGTIIECQGAIRSQAELRQLQATEQVLMGEQLLRLGEAVDPTDPTHS